MSIREMWLTLAKHIWHDNVYPRQGPWTMLSGKIQTGMTFEGPTALYVYVQDPQPEFNVCAKSR